MPSSCPSKILAGSSINAAIVFRNEWQMWLAAICCRLCGRRCVRNPFSSEIARDMPYELFVVFWRVVKSGPGEPYCFIGSNKKRDVTSFTNLHFPKVVGSNPTVARHIFQACPVWIYTQSNITQASYSPEYITPTQQKSTPSYRVTGISLRIPREGSGNIF